MSTPVDALLGVVPSPPTDVVGTPGARPPPAVIARKRGEDPFSYEALRAKGLAQAQALSGELWTDFNHHDPGVTLLEAFCYALTEDVFGARQPLVDQLAAADGRIHYRRLGLHAAEQILPCRPDTATDYVCWLLDRVPGALQAHASMPDADGLWRMHLEVRATQPEDAAVAAATRAYWAQRNLGEDLAELPNVLKPRWCNLHLDISLEGARAPEDILAELVARCAEYVDGMPQRLSLRERMASGNVVSLADALEGPPLRQGWIDVASHSADVEQRVYFGDLTRLAMSIDGVVEARRVSLICEGLDNSEGSLPRREDGRVLRLWWPDDAQALAGWRITRRGNLVALPIEPLLHRLDDLRRGTGGRASADSAPEMAGSLLARPRGHFMPAQPYVSLYQHLPRIYRERFDAALPPAEANDQAQFQAYLALLEQWLAHGAAHTRHMRELYTVGGAMQPSYAWQVLGNENMPGLADLYVDDREKVRETVFASADDSLERRNRVLDHLLALYGDGCGQGSIRAFGWYFSARAWDLHLFEQKRQMLLRIATLTRDRYGGMDYSRRSLGRRGNTCVLQQRTSLLLAFKQYHSRLLMQSLTQADLGLAAETDHFHTASEAPAQGRALALWGAGRHRVTASMGHDLASAARVVSQHLPQLNMRALPPALLRCAVHAERYQHVPGRGLWLGPDERGRWWGLRLRSAQTSAEAVAMSLHELACRMQLECEGMHVVEHILLRPREKDDTDISEDFYRHQITAVFPGWTARGRDLSFRRIAEETLALNAPAHLRIHALWLDAPAMLRFERCLSAWLEANQAYCGALHKPEDQRGNNARSLDNWTRLLRWVIWRQLSASSSTADGEGDA
ncbi:hypothetical protein [Dyella sp.]|uniref:hypothetical protein n=1 Tax=Dyella sp. TaxID=1869338 RepID=UPI002ECFF512